MSQGQGVWRRLVRDGPRPGAAGAPEANIAGLPRPKLSGLPRRSPSRFTDGDVAAVPNTRKRELCRWHDCCCDSGTAAGDL